MPTKNDSMAIDTASLLAVYSELFDKYDIITLPESANYECQETLNVLLYAATSSTNSLESACNDLQEKNPDIRIPSADTIFNYIKHRFSPSVYVPQLNHTQDITQIEVSCCLIIFDMVSGKSHSI